MYYLFFVCLNFCIIIMDSQHILRGSQLKCERIHDALLTIANVKYANYMYIS